MPLVDVPQRSEAWFEARKGKITASTAAACLGLDEHRGPLAAYNEIMGLGSRKESRAATWGLQNELRAIAAYEVMSGCLVEPTGFWVHPHFPWLGASPDGLIGTDGMVEVKCPVNPLKLATEAQIIQCRIQMTCTGRDWCDWFAWQEEEHILVNVWRDLVAEQELIDRLYSWYVKHIEPCVPPPRRRIST